MQDLAKFLNCVPPKLKTILNSKKRVENSIKVEIILFIKFKQYKQKIEKVVKRWRLK